LSLLQWNLIEFPFSRVLTTSPSWPLCTCASSIMHPWHFIADVSVVLPQSLALGLEMFTIFSPGNQGMFVEWMNECWNARSSL
jgi:hypothetical protein